MEGSTYEVNLFENQKEVKKKVLLFRKKSGRFDGKKTNYQSSRGVL